MRVDSDILFNISRKDWIDLLEQVRRISRKKNEMFQTDFFSYDLTNNPKKVILFMAKEYANVRNITDRNIDKVIRKLQKERSFEESPYNSFTRENGWMSEQEQE